MEQIKNVGVVEYKVGPDDTDDCVVLHVDPALCSAEETARITVENTTTGKPMVLVIGNADTSQVTRRLISELQTHRDIDCVAEEVWERGRQPTRRIALFGGLNHLPVLALAATVGPNWSTDCHQQDEGYFSYRLRIREEEVARGMRRPPKKAVCSPRRRGRKFKG